MNFDEILIIIGIALVVIGPQRLPEYAEQLGRLVRNLRNMATGATETIREELGDEFADLDLTKFDPRQYDPRRIVREALLEDIVPATKPARSGARAAAATPTKPVSAKAPTSAASTGKRITESTSMGSVEATKDAAVDATKDAVVEDAVVEDAPVEAAPVEAAPVADTAAGDIPTDGAAVDADGDGDGDTLDGVPVTVGAPFDVEAT